MNSTLCARQSQCLCISMMCVRVSMHSQIQNFNDCLIMQRHLYSQCCWYLLCFIFFSGLQLYISCARMDVETGAPEVLDWRETCTETKSKKKKKEIIDSTNCYIYISQLHMHYNSIFWCRFLKQTCAKLWWRYNISPQKTIKVMQSFFYVEMKYQRGLSNGRNQWQKAGWD